MGPVVRYPLAASGSTVGSHTRLNTNRSPPTRTATKGTQTRYDCDSVTKTTIVLFDGSFRLGGEHYAVRPMPALSMTEGIRRGGELRDRSDARSCEVVLRNHDQNRSYTVTIELTPMRRPGTTVTETYELAPGEIRCLSTVAPRGPTHVRGRIETGEVDAADGPLGEEPSRTALIETGNGTISVTHGL